MDAYQATWVAGFFAGFGVAAMLIYGVALAQLIKGSWLG